MKKKRLSIVFMWSLWLVSCVAQAQEQAQMQNQTQAQDSVKPAPVLVPVHAHWKFRSLDYIGGVRGEDGDFVQLQTVNGLYKKSWFLGVGAGLDYYRYRSVPLFLSVVKDLMPGRNGLFLSLDGGIDLPAYKRTWYNNWDYTKSRFLPGPYWGAELGYKIKLSSHSQQAILLSAGYSFKELREDQIGPSIDCPLGAPCPQQPGSGPVTHYTYRNQRLSVKAGISL